MPFPICQFQSPTLKFTDVKFGATTGATKDGFNFLLNFVLQIASVFLVTASCFALFLWLADSIVLTYRAQDAYLADANIAALVTRLASIGAFPAALAEPVSKLTVHLYIRDVVHICAAAGELAAILICMFVPKRFLKFGALSLSVLPPLIFVLIGSACSYTHCRGYCEPYGYFLVSAVSQTQAVALSCLLFVARAKFAKLKLTSPFDIVFFWLELVVLFSAVTQLSLTFGTFARE